MLQIGKVDSVNGFPLNNIKICKWLEMEMLEFPEFPQN